MSNATQSTQIITTLDVIPRNEPYRLYLKNLMQPIFMIGESLKGTVEILPSAKEKIKHKGIKLRLNAQYVTTEGIHHTQKIEEIELAKGGILNETLSLPFVMQKPNVQFPSYFGYKASLAYCLVVVINRAALKSNIHHDTFIVFLEPAKLKIENLPLDFSYEHDKFAFDVQLNHTYYTMDEDITGAVTIKTAGYVVKHMWVYLVLTETFQNIPNIPKTLPAEQILFKYEILDGTPMPNTQIPFVLQLAPFKIWSTKNEKNAVITSAFRIEVQVQFIEEIRCLAKQRVYIYLRNVTSTRRASESAPITPPPSPNFLKTEGNNT